MSRSGQMTERVHIPAMSGGGVEVRSGQRVKVIAVQGKQIADLFAFVLGSRDEYLSPGNTMGKLRSRQGDGRHCLRLCGKCFPCRPGIGCGISSKAEKCASCRYGLSAGCSEHCGMTAQR